MRSTAKSINHCRTVSSVHFPLISRLSVTTAVPHRYLVRLIRRPPDPARDVIRTCSGGSKVARNPVQPISHGCFREISPATAYRTQRGRV